MDSKEDFEQGSSGGVGAGGGVVIAGECPSELLSGGVISPPTPPLDLPMDYLSEGIPPAPAIRDDERDDGREDEKRGEEGVDDDEDPPHPPEMVAVVFEEAKPESIDDDGGCAPAPPPGQIAASIEGHDDEEEQGEEGEDDEAPRPPDMVAASFEAGCGHEEEKGEGEGEDDGAPPLPPDFIASSFEEHISYEEEKKREEGGGEENEDEAPRPPSMIAAALCEEIDTADQEATKKRKPRRLIEDGDDPQAVPEERTTSTQEAEENIACMQDFVNNLMREIDDVFDNDGTPAMANTGNRGRLLDPSSPPNQPPSTASNARVGAISITPTPQRGDGRNFGFAANDQGHVGLTIRSTEESMSPPRPSFDRSHQSVPLIEATLVQDVPQEPVYIYINTNSGEETVYDAFPMSDTQNNDVHGWSRISFKFRIIMLGLVLVAMAAIIGVAVMNAGNKKEPSIAPTKAETGINASDPPIAPIMTSTTSATSALVTSTTSVPPFAVSIWKEQGSAIVGNNYTLDSLGHSVALSADAKTLVVGAPGLWGNSDREGHVEVYRYDEDGGNWTQLGQTIYGNATGDSFGWSVDISADGSTILLGSPQYSAYFDRPGYARVYSLTIDDEAGANTWKQIGLDIVGEAIGDQFGLSVSISGDGKTLAVGADTNDANLLENSGHVRIYRLENDGVSWEKVGEDIVGEVTGDLLGHSVSLSANGSIVATGAILGASNPYNGVRTGQVKIFRIDSAGSSWEQLGPSIYGDNVDDVFGWSVDISPDGYTLAIGSPGSFRKTDRPGYVRVFSLEEDDEVGTVRWKRIGEDIPGDVNGDLCGWSVSLSNNARTLAVGAPYNDVNGGNSGLVRVYRIIDSKSGWMKLGKDIDGEADGDESGASVCLSGDGNTVAIGSKFSDDKLRDSGKVRVFAME